MQNEEKTKTQNPTIKIKKNTLEERENSKIDFAMTKNTIILTALFIPILSVLAFDRHIPNNFRIYISIAILPIAIGLAIFVSLFFQKYSKKLDKKWDTTNPHTYSSTDGIISLSRDYKLNKLENKKKDVERDYYPISIILFFGLWFFTIIMTIMQNTFFISLVVGISILIFITILTYRWRYKHKVQKRNEYENELKSEGILGDE